MYNEQSWYIFNTTTITKYSVPLREAVIGIQCPFAAPGCRRHVQAMRRQHHQDKMWQRVLLRLTQPAKIQPVLVMISVHTCGQTRAHCMLKDKQNPSLCPTSPSSYRLSFHSILSLLILILFSSALACLLIQSVADRKSSSGPRRDVASGYGHPSLIRGQKSERPWQQHIPCSGAC